MKRENRYQSVKRFDMKNLKKQSLILLLLPCSAFAGTNTNMFNTVFQGIADFITGTVGTAICGLAVIAIGFLWLKEGRIDKAQALTSAAGIALIYSASFVVSNVMGVG